MVPFVKYKKKTYKAVIDKFYGINESPDGDSGLKLGEANYMTNFRITAEGNLQTRPGQHTIVTIAEGHPVRAMWQGKLSNLTHNLLTNGNFASTAGWTAAYGTATVSANKLNYTMTNASFNARILLTDGIPGYAAGHIYYVQYKIQSAKATSAIAFVGGSYGAEVTVPINTLTTVSHQAEATVDGLGFFCNRSDLLANGDIVIYSEALCVDLTAIYGAGNEPAKEWCDANITYENATHAPLFCDDCKISVAVCNGNVYKLGSDLKGVLIGTLTDAPTTILPFSDKLYFLNGTEYKYWDGTTFGDVDGYRPIIARGCSPATGTGDLLEQVNKLTGKRRAWYTNTASNKTFKIQDENLSSIDYIKNTATGNEYTLTTEYTKDVSAGTVTFMSAPDTSTDLIEIGWTVSNTDRATVLGMKYFETFSGGTDAHVFLYGDGSNQVLYSGIEHETGLPSAEYFPDLNTIHVDSENTPVTNLTRHGNSLLIFKQGSTYVVTYGTITLDDDTLTQAFYVTPINRDTGNEAYGQVRLVDNSPLSLHKGSVWAWQSSAAIRNERNAVRISDRVATSLNDFNFSECVTFDDQHNSEYWIVYDGKAVIFNYKNNTWYVYTDIYATAFLDIDNELYFGTSEGTIEHFSKSYRDDNGTVIDAYWEGGSYAFGDETMAKTISDIYLTLKPEFGSVIDFKMLTDKPISGGAKTIPILASFISFARINFAHFTFNTSHRPQIEHFKYRANNFVFGKIVLSVSELNTTATVTNISIPYIYARKAR